MRQVIMALAAGCALLAAPATAAADGCCDEAKKAACCVEKATPCCGHQNDPAAEAVLIPVAAHDQAARPARELVVVRFRDPVRVGHRILMGKYIIEHDTERMARGGPCTYIYEYGKSVPTVAFHCVHLDRPHSERATVTLRPTTDPTGTRMLTEFQFAGEAAGHGVPGIRR